MTIEEGAVVRDGIVMPGARIKKGAVVEYAIIGENVEIGERVSIGARPETIFDKSKWGVAVVGPNVTVSDGAVVQPKQMVGSNI